MPSSAWTNSARHAWHGLALAWKHESNFRIELAFSGLAMGMALVLPLARWEVVSVLVVTLIVLVLELLNSALERLVDILEPRWSAPVRDVKDVLAGMVLVAAFFAAWVGVYIFLPQFFKLIAL